MEIADADIQKILAKPYSFVIRAGRQEMTTRIDLMQDILLDRQ
ncbi:MAG: hypothetical protein ACFFDR_03200 [Candidatus Thorarchaeota archaeon]